MIAAIRRWNSRGTSTDRGSLSVIGETAMPALCRHDPAREYAPEVRQAASHGRDHELRPDPVHDSTRCELSRPPSPGQSAAPVASRVAVPAKPLAAVTAQFPALPGFHRGAVALRRLLPGS